MKVLSLANTPLDPALGSGKTVLAWSQGLRELGHQVDVLPPVSFYRPWPGDKGKRIKMRLDARKLAGRILEGAYDLVEFYGAEFGLLIDKLSRFNRVSRPLLVAHTNGLELLATASSGSIQHEPKQSILRSFGAKIVQPAIAGIDWKAFSKADAFAAICEVDRDYVVNNKIQDSKCCAVVEPGIEEAFLSAPWQAQKNIGL